MNGWSIYDTLNSATTARAPPSPANTRLVPVQGSVSSPPLFPSSSVGSSESNTTVDPWTLNNLTAEASVARLATWVVCLLVILLFTKRAVRTLCVPATCWAAFEFVVAVGELVHHTIKTKHCCSGLVRAHNFVPFLSFLHRVPFFVPFRLFSHSSV